MNDWIKKLFSAMEKLKEKIEKLSPEKQQEAIKNRSCVLSFIWKNKTWELSYLDWNAYYYTLTWLEWSIDFKVAYNWIILLISAFDKKDYEKVNTKIKKQFFDFWFDLDKNYWQVYEKESIKMNC